MEQSFGRRVANLSYFEEKGPLKSFLVALDSWNQAVSHKRPPNLHVETNVPLFLSAAVNMCTFSEITLIHNVVPSLNASRCELMIKKTSKMQHLSSCTSHPAVYSIK